MRPIKAAIISLSGTSLTDDEKKIIENENPLGVSLFSRNIETPQQLKDLNRSIKEISERDDMIIAVDQEGGRVCRLKPPYFRDYMAQSAIASLEISQARLATQLHAELISNDLHQVGINCNFAPTLDVSTPDITNALKSRCFSDNGELTAELGKIMFETYQRQGIVSCIKHFPGHSGAEHDPHLELSIIPKIQDNFVYPFEKIAPLAFMGMTAHIVLQEIDDLPVTVSKKAIGNIIRGRFAFKGLLVSDALEMRSLSGSLAEKTTHAIDAGCDAVCYCGAEVDEMQIVLDNCGYLNDKALNNLQKISTLIAQSHCSLDVDSLEQQYQKLAEKACYIPDDYDAVEVLMKMKEKG